MKYPFCCLAGFRTRFLQLFDISPEFPSGIPLNFMCKLLGILELPHNTTTNIITTKYLKLSTSGGCMRNTIMPANCLGGNRTGLVNLRSLLTSTHFFFSDKAASSPFTVPLGAYPAESPFSSRNIFSSFGIFSSRRNFCVLDMALPGYELGRPFQCLLDHDFCQMRIVILNDFIWSNTGSDKLDYIADHDPRAPERGLAVTDFAVGDDIFAYLDPHDTIRKNEIFKDGILLTLCVEKERWLDRNVTNAGWNGTFLRTG